MANGWRYFAQRLTGNPDTDEIFNLDLPLQDVKIVDVLSGPTRISAKIDPVVTQMLAPDGRPLLGKWNTAIYAEHEGEVFGTILDDPKLAGPQISLNCIGFAGYPSGQPYTESWYGVDIDPLDVVRQAWTHLQTQFNGDLGVEVDATTQTPIRIGITKTVRELDPKDDPNVGPSYFESGPARLAWYETDDIGDYIDKLASDTPFDYHERHEWDGEKIRHHLDFYYPRKGNRRSDLRFVVGENIAVIPNVDTDEYATEVLALGAGEGRAMLRSTQSRPWSGLRRAVTVVDKSARTKAAVNSFARRELAWRVGLDDIADIVVRDHPHAPLAGTATRPPARVGDEIFVQGYTGWEGVGHWCRILEREIAPESGDVMKFTTVRSDKLGDPHPLLTELPIDSPVVATPITEKPADGTGAGGGGATEVVTVDPATNPNVFFIPASLTTYSSTGIGAEGHGVTDLGHVGSVNYPDANFQGSNRGKGGPYPGLPSRVPGMRFFIVGDWSEPHSFSEKIPYGMWEDAPEGGPPNFQLFYSSQLWSNRDGRELTLVTIAGTGLPAGTVRGIEVWSDNGLGETSAVSGLRNGTTNVQVTAWGTPRTKPGVHARQWAVDITGVVLIYPEGSV